MEKYYAKQVIQFNEESKKTITLDAQIILGMKSYEELGRFVRDKMESKIKELDWHTEQVKKQSNL
jgi:hypothetical protein